MSDDVCWSFSSWQNLWLNQEYQLVTQFRTQSHHHETELTSHYPILMMHSTRLGDDKYQFCKLFVWIDQKSNPWPSAWEDCSTDSASTFGRYLMKMWICLQVSQPKLLPNVLWSMPWGYLSWILYLPINRYRANAQYIQQLQNLPCLCKSLDNTFHFYKSLCNKLNVAVFIYISVYVYIYI